MGEPRVFKCAECSRTFNHDGGPMRCPECRGKTLVLVEGASLKGSKNCGGNCASCSCGCH